MAKFFGQRRKYSINMLRATAVGALLYALLGFGSFYYLFHKFQDRLFDPLFLIPLLIIFLPIFIIIYILYKKFDVMSLNFLAGLNGEKAIAAELKTLPDDYSVYVDVMIKPEQGNIDYVVIGPTGLYTIEVKSHRGVISFNGSQLLRNGRALEKDFLQQSMSEAMSLHQYFYEQLKSEIFVKPVIVFSSYAKMNFGLNSVDKVYVIQKIWLKKLIESQSPSSFLVDRHKIERVLLKLIIVK